jgi:hypothetical protein
MSEENVRGVVRQAGTMEDGFDDHLGSLPRYNRTKI